MPTGATNKPLAYMREKGIGLQCHRPLRRERGPLVTFSTRLHSGRALQGSAVTTLGVTAGDVGAWLFALWVCIEWFLNLDVITEAFMKATFKTGMEALAVLWA